MTRTTYSSRDRVLTTLANGQADRVPINYFANPGIDKRLKKHFNLGEQDKEGLLKALNVDFRSINPAYIGRKLHPDIPERGVRSNELGVRTRYIEHESGGYWDFVEFPLQNATEEEVAEWPLPSPDDYDYSVVPQMCSLYEEYAICIGHAGMPDIMNGNGRLRGMEQTYLDLALDEPAGLLLAKRTSDLFYEYLLRILDKAKGRIDILWLGEDIGTQRGPLISMDTYRKHLKSHHQRFIDLAKNFNIPSIMHTCGSSSWVYPELIEMGLTGVDTLQPEATDMSPEYLKRTFGGKLALHGCISTAGPVAYGTTEETIAYCKKTLEIMMPGGGYCFAPTHQLQDNSPVENVLAMYKTAFENGRY